MVAVRDLSKSDGAFKYLIYRQYSTLKDFSQVELVLCEEQLHKNMVNGRCLCNPSHRLSFISSHECVSNE